MVEQQRDANALWTVFGIDERVVEDQKVRSKELVVRGSLVLRRIVVVEQRGGCAGRRDRRANASQNARRAVAVPVARR